MVRATNLRLCGGDKMGNENYIFQISPYDINGLLAQVSKALEKRTELISRERYPNMWKFTDRMNTAAQGKSRSSFRTKLLSIVCVVLGIFLLVPGLVEPQELFVPLLTGTAALMIGIVGLWRSRKNQKNPFDKSAKLLLTGRDVVPEGQAITVIFSDDGMTIPTDDRNTEFVPYNDFECTIETTDAFLFVYGDRVMVLQKKDLTTGNLTDFSNQISEKVTKYQSI